jgi:hypothetical protein
MVGMLRGIATILAVAVLASVACTVSPQGPGGASAPSPRPFLQIESVPVDGGRRWLLYLDGTIEPGADRRLAEFVREQRITRADVYIDSPGGSLLAGMAIGRVLRERGFDTHVARRTADAARPADGACFSACPFAYAGGVRRWLRPGSVLGVHRAHNRVPVPDDEAFERRVSEDATQYLIEMGVSPALVGIMREEPSGGIRVLTRDEAMALRLVNSRT